MADGELKGRVAVVTGGNGGIGLGMARGFAAAGAAVVVSGRNAEKSRRAVGELQALGAQAVAIEADIADESAVNGLIRGTVERFGRLDILVNNAGMNIRKPVQELTLAEWRQVLDTNLTSAFLTSRAAYPIMKKNRGGKIINIGSMMSIFGASFAPAYAASKGGIVQLTKATASAWARDNIQVNAVLPGWIDTELTTNARREVQGL
ncbi:MAG: SDR family NAD(P)-dependent oxidoreductase, partial [Candidatus Rokuibacteriota bacterium]